MATKHTRAEATGTENLEQYLLPENQMKHLLGQKSLLGQMRGAIIVTNSYGQPVSYNRVAADLLGEIPAHLLPEEWPQKYGIYQQDGKTSYPVRGFPLSRALQGENVEAEEVYLKTGNVSHGTWMTMSAAPLISQRGNVEGAIVFFNDSSLQKNAEILREKQVKRAEASYLLSQQIAKLVNDPMQILNTVVEFGANIIGDGCVAALVNPQQSRLNIVAYHHIKPSARSLLQKSVLSREYGLDGAIETVIQSGEALLLPVVERESLLENSSLEQTRYVDEIGVQSLLIIPIKGRNGILGILSLFRDKDGLPYTTEDLSYVMDVAYRTGLAIDNSALVNSLRVESSVRKITEKALELSEVRFQSIFTSTALGIKLLDLEGNIIETNPAFQNILGYSATELRGKPVSSFWYPEDARLLTQLMDKLKTDRVQSFQLEHRVVGKDGSIVWFNVTFTGIKRNELEESLGFIVAIAENITKRKRIEAEMMEMKSRLHSHIEMERLQLAQELHDGPLQDLYSAIYKIEYWGDQGNRERIETLKQDLLTVIQDLRNTAKNLRPPALANFGLEKAIRSHAEEFKETLPELTIHLNLAQDKQSLPEDIRLILFRIYQHSLANVIRHAKASEVHVRFAFDAEEAQLEVSDNGVGFDVPSSWVELVRQGHFGLAGAVERVGLLEGKFNVESTPGKGTSVRVVIPIREMPSPEVMELEGRKHERH
jgi:PAS domain S-box-containing protein